MNDVSFCDWVINTEYGHQPLRPVKLQAVWSDDGEPSTPMAHLRPEEAEELAHALLRAAKAARKGRAHRQVLPPVRGRS